MVLAKEHQYIFFFSFLNSKPYFKFYCKMQKKKKKKKTWVGFLCMCVSLCGGNDRHINLYFHFCFQNKKTHIRTSTSTVVGCVSLHPFFLYKKKTKTKKKHAISQYLTQHQPNPREQKKNQHMHVFCVFKKFVCFFYFKITMHTQKSIHNVIDVFEGGMCDV